MLDDKMKKKGCISRPIPKADLELVWNFVMYAQIDSAGPR
jgi:hypothetical protein